MIYALRRLLAHLLDIYGVFFCLLLAGFLLSLLLDYAGLDFRNQSTFNILVSIFVLASFPAYKALATYFSEGQTSGKGLFLLKVVGPSGSELSLLECFFREFLRTILYLISFSIMAFVDLILVAWRNDKRTITDLITGTRVINENESADLQKDEFRGLFGWWRKSDSRKKFALGIASLALLISIPFSLISPTINHYYHNRDFQNCSFYVSRFSSLPGGLNSSRMKISLKNFEWGKITVEVVPDRARTIRDELTLEQHWLGWEVVDWKRVKGCG
jgi:uncharacterized RDD family membrane protein YckC